MADMTPERIYLWNHPRWAAVERDELPYSAWPVTDPNGGAVEYVRADLAARGEVVATARFRHTRDGLIAVANVQLADDDAFTDADGYAVEIVRRLPGDATGGAP